MRGARGETASEMADVLHLGTEPGIHDSFRELLASLNPEDDSRPFDLAVANALWPQQGFPFRQEFLQLIETQYGGGSQSVDYRSPAGREAARNTINAWVEENTHGKIKDLIPQGALNELTRLVLTNAIYFKGQWLTEFDTAMTADLPFYLESGEAIDTPMMYSQSKFRYCEQDGFQVLEMPYKGEDLSMTILLPNADTGLDDLTGSTLSAINEWLATPSAKQDVIVRLPKFKTTVSSSLGTVLQGMGMPLAFDPQRADFSGMSDGLHIQQVLHKAFVEVNEEGTEAAAATAVITGVGCFAAGTPLLTPEGQKPIEQIQTGDYVLSRDQRDVNGPVEAKLVEETFVRSSMILNLHVAGQVVRTTKEHPFYVRDRGWTAAGQLQAGDLLATDNGRWLEVEKVVDTAQLETVYNLRVADYHTYFVAGQWGAGLWSHNTYGPPPVSFTADHPFHFFIRDNQTGAMLFMGRITDPLEEENSLSPTVDEEASKNSIVGQPGASTFSPEETTALGPVDFLELFALDPSAGDLWYSVETMHDGLLTMEALTSDVQLALYDADSQELAVSSPAGGIQRLDWLADAGESFFLRLTGDAADVDLRLANLVCREGTTLTVHGTTGDDLFIFDASQGRNVTINGILYPFDNADLSDVTFDAGDGIDTVRFYDSAADETFTVQAGPGDAATATFASTGNYSVVATGAEQVLGWSTAGGHDKALFSDSAQDDKLKASGEDRVAILRKKTNPHTFYLRAKKFEEVRVTAGADGGADKNQAILIDSPGHDRFFADASAGSYILTGREYSFDAQQFQRVIVRSSGKGIDRATMIDTSANDKFVGTPTQGRLFSLVEPINIKVKNFDAFVVHATRGGLDKARFFDSLDNDQLVARQHKTTFTGPGFDFTVRQFEQVFAFSELREGEHDTVEFFDTADNDLLEASGQSASLSTDNSQLKLLYQALAFEQVTAHRTQGDDVKSIAAIDYLLMQEGDWQN